MRFRSLAITLILLSLWTFAGCGRDSGSPAGEKRRVVDDLGNVVEVPDSLQRIISLAPNVTELVWFLGESRRLIGVTTQCDWPEEALRLPRVGDFSHPGLERIVALSPDLVLATSVEQQQWNRKLSALGIPVYTVYPRTCDELVESMRRLLALFGNPRQGADSLEAFSRRLDRFRRVEEGPGEPIPRVYVEISDNPLMTAGKGSFVDDLIRRAGGANVVGRLERDYCIINQERIVEADPEVIFVLHGLADAGDVARRIGWEGVSAVHRGRIYDDVDLDLVLRAGPRILQGLRLLEERIHEAL